LIRLVRDYHVSIVQSTPKEGAMKKLSWRVKFGLILVTIAAVLLYIHSLVFHDQHEFALFFGTHEIAMMPLEVLVVTLIIHSLLERRSKNERMDKLNMVIGAFFSEVGSELLRRISTLDKKVEVRQQFLFTTTWDKRRYAEAKRAALSYDYGVDANTEDLKELKSFLTERRPFLLSLLQNPSLLEHQSFTDGLWAVFHLTEELDQRVSLDSLAEPDRLHLVGDTKRAYASLAVEWLDHVQHLQKEYPYLFSLAVRSNPLNPDASITVTA